MSKQKSAMIKFAVSMILLFITYFPTFVWMYGRWIEKESYYGHGFLVPIVSLFVIWQRREVLKKIVFSGDLLGLVFIGAGLFIHIICAALKVYFISGFSFIFVLYGLILFLFGKETARNLIFPVFFLFTMIPLPLVLIGNITVKLKLFAAQAATFILNRIGFPCVRDGSLLRMPASFLAVEAPCSGLRSLISLLTLGLLFAYAAKISYLKKSVLFLSSAPIALISNIFRIIMLAIVNDLYGEKVVMGFFHDFTGFFVFAIAFASLFGVAQMLETRKNEN